MAQESVNIPVQVYRRLGDGLKRRRNWHREVGVVHLRALVHGHHIWHATTLRHHHLALVHPHQTVVFE